MTFRSQAGLASALRGVFDVPGRLRLGCFDLLDRLNRLNSLNCLNRLTC